MFGSSAPTHAASDPPVFDLQYLVNWSPVYDFQFRLRII
jgi:hypothetical protein